MSTSREISPERPKFTRGEKCIFTHLIITFSILLLLIIIYFIHLCMVTHSLRDVWKIARRTHTNKKNYAEAARFPVGYVYLSEVPVRLLCNTVLLASRWSVGPGHCVAIRSDPDMSSWILAWRIGYKAQDNNFIESKIKRTIPHPHFDRDDFRNNIGLFEHASHIQLQPFIFRSSVEVNDYTLRTSAQNVALIGWNIDSTAHGENQMALIRYEVQPVSSLQCNHFMSPILDLRNYEYCVLARERDMDHFPDHGSVLVIDSDIMGFFAWGEKSGRGVPYIILDMRPFKEWLENIIAW